ncbi:MAG TPA: tetratricopeptide repeat protein [Opitutaceae bacterium]|nr:tetratricopeptide repeat protein [Opitutaceae bacterium]
MRPRTRTLLCAAALVLGLLLAYGDSFGGPFVFDDLPSIPENPTIRHLWPPGPALHPPPAAGVGGRPVLNLTFALNYAASGLRVWSYHAANLLIHLAAALALFGIVRRTLRRCAPAWGEAEGAALALAAALLWALHPAQTATVTYLSQRAEGLMGLLYLLTLYCFVRGAGSARPRGGPWFLLSALSCLLGVATKEVMVTAPFVVLLYDRIYLSGSWAELWRRRWGAHLALFASWILVARLLADVGARGVGAGQPISPRAYALIECWVVPHYLAVAAWPRPIIFDYGFNPAAGPVLPWVLALGLILAAVLAGLLLRPRAAFPAACFFILLSPTSSVVPIAYDPMVLNRIYLPLAGLAVLAALAARRWFGRPGYLALAAMVLVGAFLTARRNEDYRSAIGLWQDTAIKLPGNARAHNNLGELLLAVPGERAKAIAELQAALRLKPDYLEARVNLGNAYANIPGRREDAAAEYRAALRIDPDYAQAHNNLGALRLGQALQQGEAGRLDEAIAELRTAVRLRPDYGDAHYDLGLALREAGRLPEAIAEDEAAVRLEPENADAQASLARALIDAPGRQAEALGHYRAAARLAPGDAAYHLDLANALVRLRGDRGEAIAEYRRAAELDPGDARAHNNLGRALSEVPGQLDAAIAEYREALRLRPDYPEARRNLAAARARLHPASAP